jgi:hypothetical protein
MVILGQGGRWGIWVGQNGAWSGFGVFKNSSLGWIFLRSLEFKGENPLQVEVTGWLSQDWVVPEEPTKCGQNF